MQTLRVVVILLAVAGILKGAYGIFWPAKAQKWVDWWLEIPPVAARFAGVVMGVGGAVLIGIVVWHVGHPVLAVSVLVGAIAIAAGFAYQYPTVWRAAYMPFSSRGPTWRVRASAVVALLLAALLLVAAFWRVP